MGSPWLPMDPYSVRIKPTASGRLCKHLPGPPRQVFGLSLTKHISIPNKSPGSSLEKPMSLAC